MEGLQQDALRRRLQALGAEDELEADIRRVGAICLVDFCDVLWVCEGNVHALVSALVSVWRTIGGVSLEVNAHIVQCSAMLCGLNDLDRGVLANLGGVVDGQGDLW